MKTDIKILVIEDELAIQNVIQTYLESAGYGVILTESGAAGLEIARQIKPDLIVLDLMLPGMDGMEVTARLRQEADERIADVYILMLTARSEEMDRIAGLRMGADDYLTKPFSPRELVARVEAILRRRRTQIEKSGPEDDSLQLGDLFMAPSRAEAQVQSQPVDLTTTEFQLLLFFARHPGQVLNREQILNQVWGRDFYGTDRIVDVYVGQVRRKLEEIGGDGMIQTVRGMGYKLVVPQASQNGSETNSSETNSGQGERTDG